jgi:RNA polymerase sigma-70 factor (ECF subfamily)
LSLTRFFCRFFLIAAMQGIDKFQGRSNLKTWVFSILKRKIIDAMRSKRREVSVSPVGSGSDEENDVSELFNQKGFWATEHAPHRWTEPEDTLEQKQF